jgi:hypothetical protein
VDERPVVNCPECGQLAFPPFEAAEEMAEMHCDARCEECGSSHRGEGWRKCAACQQRREQEREEARFQQATKISSEVYTGPVYAAYVVDGITVPVFFESVIEAIEDCEYRGVVPRYFYGVRLFDIRGEAVPEIDDTVAIVVEESP